MHKKKVGIATPKGGLLTKIFQYYTALTNSKVAKIQHKNYFITFSIIFGVILIRFVAFPGIEAIEAVNPAKTGFLGGLAVYEVS